MKKILVFDTETTGLSENANLRIVTFAFLNFPKPSPEPVVTLVDLRKDDPLPFKQAWEEMDAVVGFNLPMDLRFVEKDLGLTTEKPKVCLMEWTEKLTGQRFSLVDLVALLQLADPFQLRLKKSLDKLVFRSEMLPKEAYDYAVQDCVFTYKVAQALSDLVLTVINFKKDASLDILVRDLELALKRWYLTALQHPELTKILTTKHLIQQALKERDFEEATNVYLTARKNKYEIKRVAVKHLASNPIGIEVLQNIDFYVPLSTIRKHDEEKAEAFERLAEATTVESLRLIYDASLNRHSVQPRLEE